MLIICIGKATRLAEEIQRSDKEYVAGVTFGATTPSYDLEKPIDKFYAHDGVTPEAVAGALKSFIGEQEQIAPLFSAKSVDGVRAYELARKLYRAGSLDALDAEAAALLSRQVIRIEAAELLAFEEADLEGECPAGPPSVRDNRGPQKMEHFFGVDDGGGTTLQGKLPAMP